MQDRPEWTIRFAVRVRRDVRRIISRRTVFPIHDDFDARRWGAIRFQQFVVNVVIAAGLRFVLIDRRRQLPRVRRRRVRQFHAERVQARVPLQRRRAARCAYRNRRAQIFRRATGKNDVEHVRRRLRGRDVARAAQRDHFAVQRNLARVRHVPLQRRRLSGS
jgi:hypothetical protein